MKFFKTCAIALAMSGMMCGIYGVNENAPVENATETVQLEGVGRRRGAITNPEISNTIKGNVRGMVTVIVDDQQVGKTIDLYTNTGEKTEEDARKIVFEVKNVGTGYKIKFEGKGNLVARKKGEHEWTMKADNTQDAEIGVDVFLYPGENADEVKIESSTAEKEFLDSWKSGEWTVLIDPQALDENTTIDTYTGTLNIKIEATN